MIWPLGILIALVGEENLLRLAGPRFRKWLLESIKMDGRPPPPTKSLSGGVVSMTCVLLSRVVEHS